MTCSVDKGRDAYVLADDIWPEDYCPPDQVDHYAPEQDLLKEQVMKFLDRPPEAQQQVIKAVYVEEIPIKMWPTCSTFHSAL